MKWLNEFGHLWTPPHDDGGGYCYRTEGERTNFRLCIAKRLSSCIILSTCLRFTIMPMTTIGGGFRGQSNNAHRFRDSSPRAADRSCDTITGCMIPTSGAS